MRIHLDAHQTCPAREAGLHCHLAPSQEAPRPGNVAQTVSPARSRAVDTQQRADHGTVAHRYRMQDTKVSELLHRSSIEVCASPHACTIHAPSMGCSVPYAVL